MNLIINIIKRYPKLFKFIKRIINKIKKITYKYLKFFIKVESNMVIFDSFLGKSYSCNPKAIYESMQKDARFKDWKFVWVTRKSVTDSIEGATKVRYNSIKHLYYLAKAKYWVFNSKMPVYMTKKKNQIYLQTWHGTPLKKLARDIEIGDNATFYRSKMTKLEMVKTYDEDVKKYNYLISPNSYSTQKFISAFGINKERIIETGYPRNDILTNYTKEQVDKIKEKLGIDKNKKIILYAPTWRDNVYDKSGYSFVPDVDFGKWKNELSEEYIVIYKPHYLIVNNIDKDSVKDFVYFAKATDNIQDLYLISDILVTDYSSVFFDYSILKRPILFYMFDLKEYSDEIRGFYIDISTLPGPIIEKEDELLKSIKNINEINEEYKLKYESFVKDITYLEDGNASNRVIDLVFKV